MQRPSSPSMMLGHSSISMASVIKWFMYLDLVNIMLVSCSWNLLPKLTLCFPDMIYLDSPERCTRGAPWPWFQWNSWSVQCRVDHIHRVCCTHLKSPVPCCPSWTEENWASSSEERPTDFMYLDSTWLLWLKVVLPVTGMVFLWGCVTLFSIKKACRICWSLQPLRPKVALKDSRSSCRFSWPHSALALCTKVVSTACVLKGWWWWWQWWSGGGGGDGGSGGDGDGGGDGVGVVVVVLVPMAVMVWWWQLALRGVCVIDSVAQWVISFMTDVDIKERKIAISFHLHNSELDVLMDTVHLVMEVN